MSSVEKEKELEELELEKQFQRELTTILRVNTMTDFPEALVPTQFEPKDLERWRNCD